MPSAVIEKKEKYLKNGSESRYTVNRKEKMGSVGVKNDLQRGGGEYRAEWAKIT